MRKYIFFDDNVQLYAQMLKDIESAEKYVFLETYIFDDDNIGRKFKRTLLKKAKEKVDVRILVDGIGSTANKSFFRDIVEEGGDVRIFREFEWSFKLVKHNSSRDHRKLLIIDGGVVYVGSSNITSRSLVWREANLRINDELVKFFEKIFLENFNLFDKRLFLSRKYVLSFVHREFEIIRDVPSLKYRNTRKKQISMIRNAKKEVLIESAYFLPDMRMRKELKDVRERGVKVTLAVPKYSDMRIVDMLREKYLGSLHEYGINIMLYVPEVLHSKLMIVDEKFFIVGSSNMDHRSNALQFEINLFGSNRHVVKDLVTHFHQTLSDCEAFDYDRWKRRSWAQKLIEKLLSTVRYFF